MYVASIDRAGNHLGKVQRKKHTFTRAFQLLHAIKDSSNAPSPRCRAYFRNEHSEKRGSAFCVRALFPRLSITGPAALRKKGMVSDEITSHE